MRVFLTGASSGIGAALARRYAAQGATLALVARRGDQLQDLVRTLPLAAGAAPHRIYPLDVTDSNALRSAAHDFMREAGIPDIVIANAGISIGILSEHAEDLDVFRNTLNTNLLAMAATFQPFIAPMREAVMASPGRSLRPSLVGIASVAGVRGLPGSGAYCASKAGVISYCESLRVELRAAGIRVVTLLPGFIDSPMTAHNPYRMPFLMPAERFAEKAAQAIKAGVRQRVIPWQMGIVASLLRCLPNWLYDLLFANAQHKPRLKK